MNPKVISEKIKQSTQAYLELLANFSNETFQKNTVVSGWSCSEVYAHIVRVNFYALTAIEKCLYSKQGPFINNLPWLSRLTFLLGKFPFRIKSPDSMAAGTETVRIENARNDLIKFKYRLEEIISRIPKFSPDCRIRHPYLGMLNSKQWLQFIEIHNRHHLKQVQRIMKFVSREAAD